MARSDQYFLFFHLCLSFVDPYFLTKLNVKWALDCGGLQVDPDNVRPIQEGTVDPLLEAEKVAEATKEALKRKIAQAAAKDFQSKTLPPKLRIEPDDPEDVVCLGFYLLFNYVFGAGVYVTHIVAAT